MNVRKTYVVRTLTTDGYGIERGYQARTEYEAISMGRRGAIAAFPNSLFLSTRIVSINEIPYHYDDRGE